MAVFCYSHTQLFYSLFVFCFLFRQTKALTFNFTDIGTQRQNISTFDDAYISSQGLQVTSDERNSDRRQKTGRATYIDSFHLWDKPTGTLADFYTHFTFVIDSNGSSNFADGLAFFLAPHWSNSTPGEAIGLPIDPQTIKPTSPFVAVEFDTFLNPGVDPVNISPVTHVGINVNSLISNVTAIWYCDIPQGIENEAWINYDSSSMNLSVIFTRSTNTSTRVKDGIYFIVDLRDHLPESVDFGFTAATGASFEKNNVKSWEFISSSLQINESKNGTNDNAP